ncbi:RNA 2',3'-cyclic phosphodiesterase [Streptomyces palmae]|uniref:RNA 2',3'-cyclic phosphodiesterase n=1 Tax=Streptomyces palmae TaxID=1701085 RepID=A0A4Z0GVF1_9ACTN|nr:RNA 2',3'-cyclic phosphodiesterase [Streptomyces palmae]TGB00555.1 RNA 2',3'-cyclic phosphodiesterase [Streptomyces palmae]
MRLFAATYPPPDALAALATAVAGLRDLPGADRLRWTGEDGWHFTLAFYGEVPDELVPELGERLGRAAHRSRPHTLRLTGGGRFAHRVLWVGAEGDLAVMSRLADSATAAGRRLGLDMEQRAYTPHLTIARGRARHADLAGFAAALADFRTAAWTEGELHLVRSRLPAGGVLGAQPRYETVGSWPLGG